ncbi:hypothetical protein GCM10010464_88820 [Pseudonocardia yunnanensis]
MTWFEQGWRYLRRGTPPARAPGLASPRPDIAIRIAARDTLPTARARLAKFPGVTEEEVWDVISGLRNCKRLGHLRLPVTIDIPDGPSLYLMYGAPRLVLKVALSAVVECRR